ncbi:MAG: Hsp20/alpha crystallin family protein [Calditrichaceae bacterium]|nr:Hsp20/alpha crystallin family protein [Calditrichaceae bacterium]MBN2709268.1 Hsp20/alpha crystallin family protein [Calditrichaceae bacterium]RQV96221.1 MAG: Hsp20/alpha crystallin family protein [Calditrichota bacterium]
MTLVKYSPAHSLFNIRNDVEKLFDNFFKSDFRYDDQYGAVVPAINVEETDDTFNISAELPGMKKDDIKITFENNVLSISGEKKTEKEFKEGNFHHFERSSGKFCRNIGIPSGVKLDKIDAEYKDGVLNIVVPKAEEAKPKEIAIKVK